MKNIFKFSAFYLLLLIIYPIFVNAYSYTGEKWSSYPVSIDVTDLSFPSEWISSLANSMTTWNNTSSPFYFNSGSSGHKIITVNRGINGVPAFASCNAGSILTDCDIEINSSYTWSTSGESGKYDVQNILTHELGHWLKLHDLYLSSDSEKTMYGSAYTGETKKRTLDTDDINGINAIYP